MPKCTIDGKSVEFQAGTNLIEVARQAGIEIPYYCYHPAMTVVAQCRMCAVEIEGMPKLQTACSTPATEGMVVKTTSERAKANQKSVQEFLLINHPLDCSICDKAGECDLQDFSFKYGSDKIRYEEVRRTFIDEDMGPVIKKNMNRCIHCTRCIRFGQEIAKIPEIVAVQRGNHTEIVTVENKPLQTEYAGNYADICPTGSLTIKDFRFKKRVWYLKRHHTICEGCSRGCNMELWAEKDTIYRCTPRTNMEINKYWLCDEGRFNFRYVNDASRVSTPLVKSGGELKENTWSAAIGTAQAVLNGKKTMVLVGSDLTQEELTTLQGFAKKMGAPIFHFGTPGVLTSKDDVDIDSILKRKSKTANLHGAEKLGLQPFTAAPAGINAALIFRGGRSAVPQLSGVTQVGVGVFFTAELKAFDVILPSTSFAEKDGTIVNWQGTEQKLKAAVPPVGGSKHLAEVLALWSGGVTPSAGDPSRTREAARV
jgi:NADH-quinone oxidoreductase subunit G